MCIVVNNGGISVTMFVNNYIEVRIELSILIYEYIVYYLFNFIRQPRHDNRDIV